MDLMASSETKAIDPTALRQALAELRSRLDQQQAIILDGFATLRHEIDSLDAQVRELAAQSTAPDDVEPILPNDLEEEGQEFTADEGEAEPAASSVGISPPDAVKPVPVGSVAVASTPIGTIPVGKAVAPPQDDDGDDDPLPSEAFRFGDDEPTIEAAPDQFNFNTTPAGKSTAKPVTPAPQPAQPAPRPVQPTATAIPQTTAATPRGEAINMEHILFGLDLAANQSLSPERQSLLQGLYAGQREAMTLLGQILIFRGATPDRMPALLKDIGEAYYRWRPDSSAGHDAFRDELTGWLQRKCDEAGVPNMIELVRPGDRYDSKRHHSKDRGIEVDQVQGWVVLRDNGKVYTKASVTLK
jgi:hypothetical protein